MDQIAFRSAHLIRTEPLRVRGKPLADGWSIVANDGNGQRQMQLRQPGRGGPLPENLDALAFCAIPLAMRSRRMLHVEGTLTRGALRNLREIAEAWANWNPDAFAAVDVSCEAVVDNERREGTACIAAWSGDLRSSVAATGGDEVLAAAGYRPDTAVHVLGLGHPTPDAEALSRLAQAFRAVGVDLVRVTTDAEAGGFLDPQVGALPIVAAALHLVGDGQAGMAIHAEAQPICGQLIRPRRRPTLGAFFSGDRMDVLSVGGTTSLPRMADWISGQEPLEPLLAGCRATGFRAPRCGRCGDCRRLDLGRLGAGLGSGGLRPAFDFDDSELEAEGILALADWRGPRLARWRLAARIVASEVRRARRDHAVWQSAMRGEAAPWPR